MIQLQPELTFLEHFYSPAKCADVYRRLCTEQNWPDNSYSLDGRKFTLPRLQTWHADAGIHYSYSNNLLQTRPWSPLLTDIRVKIETALNYAFNSVLVNWYHKGEDYVGWHSDNEPELGPQPLIASLSLGASRTFAYKHKINSEQGSILLNRG
jgi:alkylated DNA repair dioxygenase AlkB